MQLENKPFFIISIDVEMLWGPRRFIDRRFLEKRNEDNRNAVKNLLELFDKHKISATWAVVGHLFLEDCTEKTCLTYKNINSHNYKEDWYNDPYSNINTDPMYYGKDVVEAIMCEDYHEVGYHSFSHPRFTEITRKMAEDEIKEAIKIGKEWNIDFKSFVFPGNEIDHVEILKKYGFKIYRGKGEGRYNIGQNIFLRKINGIYDKLIAPTVQPIFKDGIWEIKSSMYFLDLQTPFFILPKAKLGLRNAIKNNEVFHIFLHPWDLLREKNLETNLDKFLRYLSKKQKENRVEIITMGDLADHLGEINGL